MRAGRALCDQWALDKAWKTLCACGHPMPQHHNHRPTYTIVGNNIVETPHPEYHPRAFKCDACACVIREVMP